MIACVTLSDSRGSRSTALKAGRGLSFAVPMLLTYHARSLVPRPITLAANGFAERVGHSLLGGIPRHHRGRVGCALGEHRDAVRAWRSGRCLEPGGAVLRRARELLHLDADQHGAKAGRSAGTDRDVRVDPALVGRWLRAPSLARPAAHPGRLQRARERSAGADR